jgi:coatomer subunit beta
MTSLVVERSCSLLVWSEKPESAQSIREALEGGDPTAKAAAMKNVISQLLNGEVLPQVFITIVRYVLPSEDHTVQKLLLLYMEIIEKTGADGRILPEMILICQNLRNNLQSPNEYLRGVTLRFLCRIKETDLLEPLVPSILANLEHRHSFVRRNAVLAIESIYRLPGGEHLLPDAPETVERFLASESDLSARRNAFLMLCNTAQERALAYLLQNVEQVTSWGDILQTVVLDLIRKARARPRAACSPQRRGGPAWRAWLRLLAPGREPRRSTLRPAPVSLEPRS